MTNEEEFILLIVSNTYLTNDFEYSLRVALKDVSFIANSCLFESNILRYRALASLKLFQECLDENNEDFGATLKYLTTAISSL